MPGSGPSMSSTLAAKSRIIRLISETFSTFAVNTESPCTSCRVINPFSVIRASSVRVVE